MNVPIIAVYIFLIMRLYYHENIKLISLLRSIVIFLSSKFIIHMTWTWTITRLIFTSIIDILSD